MICTSNTSSAIESFHTAQEGSNEAVQWERGAARGSECRTAEVSSRASSQHLSSWHPQMRGSVPQTRLTKSGIAVERGNAGAATPHRPRRAPICILGRRPSTLLPAHGGAQFASKWLCRLPQAVCAAHPSLATGQPGSLPETEQPANCSEAQTPKQVLSSGAQPARKRLCRASAELSPATPSSAADESVSFSAAGQPPATSVEAQAQTAQQGLGSPQAAMQGPSASQPMQECSKAQSACNSAGKGHLQPDWGRPASSSPEKHEVQEGLHAELDTAVGSPTHKSEMRAPSFSRKVAPMQSFQASMRATCAALSAMPALH